MYDKTAELHWFEAHGVGKKENGNQSISGLTMSKTRRPDRSFAICIKVSANDMLTLRKVYQMLPDESGARSNFIRVIDDEGEDYLYPADHFIVVDLPAAVGQTLQQVS